MRRTIDVLQNIRYDEGHHPVGCPLLGGEVRQPLPQKVANIEEVRGGGGEDCYVTSPAEPLITLWAIGGNIEEVATQRRPRRQ